MNTKQPGLGKVAIIGLIAAVLIAGAVAYVLMARGDESKKTAQATTAATKATATNKESAAATLVKSSYTAYLDAAKGDGIPPSAMTAFEANTTSEFTNTLKTGKFSYDPILCATNVPISISYGTPTLEGTMATIELMSTYANPPTLPITVMVDTTSNKISRIVCHLDD